MGGREAGKEGGRKEEGGRGRKKDLKDRKQKEERLRGMHTHTLQTYNVHVYLDVYL